MVAFVPATPHPLGLRTPFAPPTPSRTAAPRRPHSRAMRKAPACIATPDAPPPAVTRRAALRLSAAAALAPWLLPPVREGVAPAAAAVADAATLGEPISDSVYGYQFSPPASGWSKQLASLSSARSAIILTRDGGPGDDTNISFVVTPVPGDFQKLTSFGTLENVLSTLVPSGQADVDGEVISTTTDSKNNSYVIEYTITSKGVKRHLLTVFSLQPGRYLLTLTGQAKDDIWPQVETTVRSVIDSYKLLKVE